MRRSIALWTAVALLAAWARPADAAGFAGVWKLTPSANTPQAPSEAILTLKQEGETVSGMLAVEGRQIPLQDVAVKGNELRFKVTTERDGGPITYAIKLTVDGDRLKGTAETPDAPTIEFTGVRQPEAGLSGKWNLTIETPNQTYRPTVTLTQEGEKLSGVFRTENGDEAAVQNGSVKSDAVAFVVELNVGGDALRLEFSGKRVGSGLKGELRVGDFTAPWTGERTDAAPEAE